MRKLFGVIALLVVGATLGVSSASAQTTYTQTNHTCQLYQCVGAQFDPAASLSYYLPEVFNALNRGQANVTFTNQYAFWCVGAGCTKVEYEDFNGTLTRTIHSSNPNCPISTFCYELSGTFNAGNETADFKWVCVRSCGDNNSGDVVAN